MRSEKGFTLLELVLVILIIGITAGILINQLDLGNYATLRLAARTVYSDFKNTSELARINQQRFEIQLDYHNSRYSIVNVDTGEVLEINELEEGITLDETHSTWKGGARLFFNPTGTASNGSLFITNNNGQRSRIIVGGIGRVRLEH